MTATTIEEQRKALNKKVKKRILDELYYRDEMTQGELAEMIGEGVSQTNRAINGENSPKSVAIRNKIFKMFNITDI